MIDYPTAVAKIHAILADEAGIPRSNRMWSNFASPAAGLVHGFARDRIVPEGPIGAILAELGKRLDQEAEARVVRIAEGEAWSAARHAIAAPPDGTAFIHLRDDVTGIVHKLAVPLTMIVED